MNLFNTLNSLLVITSYPNPKNNKYGKRDLNAVAWHSEKTLKELAKNRRVIVLAEKAHKDDQSFYGGKNIFVDRIWSKNNHFSMFSIAWEALKLNYVKTIYIPFEFNVFGGTFHNLLFLIVLLILRLNGKNITIEVHQVIEDIKKLEKHINITNLYVQKFFNFGLKIFYFLFGVLANNIIVFEEELKTRLKKYINENKVNVLSLSVQKSQVTNKNYARKKLSLPKKDFLVMVFGYINGYKGIDYMTEAFSKIRNKNIRLIIAGGENPYLRNKKFYQKFYQKITQAAKINKNTILTGFVPDNKVGLYFSSADLIVLPYEVFMSASGPFSLALSYGKPMILSNKLISYKQSNDFKLSLEQTGLKSQEIFFPLKKEAILSLIKKIKNDQELTKKLTLFSKNLAEKRNSEKVIDQYEKILLPNLDLGFVEAKRKKLKLIYN
ncbi:MAG: lipopolysaccharide transferase family protein [uncultured bacterium]|nr:MAG: lipopolysaccharide transferase family protein [uncultured bacterium]